MTTTATSSTPSTMLSLPSPPSSSSSSNPTRPSFNSHRTQDRLREGETPYVLFRAETSNLQRGRKSVFKETGLLDDAATASITPDISINTDLNLNIVATGVNDEDDSSASGVSLLQSPITSPMSSTESGSNQPAPFPPLQDMPVQARNDLQPWHVCTPGFLHVFRSQC
ncbi:hypothetical protein CCMA1212_003493 [Trichoderma ghanense]|uniref:Uncharacterized protein n=1 Tax=Trichoderma ghanense TaxID=65468 RepID=A0ABY2H9V4_9HYPO